MCINVLLGMFIHISSIEFKLRKIMSLRFNERTGMFEEVVDTFSNTSSRTSYKPKSPQRQNDDDDWKLGCGFLVFIIVAVFFCVKTCGSDSSTNERIEGVDSVDRIESVDTKHIQDQKPVVSESKDVQTTKADF